ncbi:phosphohydrolase [Effusibacillus lacus]|uniref:Phosphohydrolase n=2 Tax=Effusibacillus lacus TaxID=1348429 RepID=A0A292YRU2_9BACL|nr:HD domain-containing protein [Effusibacillus lacus]TCS76862.1 putative hydrolase of HD superfamily [Effusibacillus lacus]GAX91195.1 phosphohydrolase [Effusibacillus lacus]
MDYTNHRLARQIEFLMEIDKLKQIFRQSFLTDKTRNENDAEHSWHLAMMAIVLSEYANQPDLDLLRVVKMLLIHDIVEIDAGDTFAYDVKGYEDKEERELQAADRLFNLLPPDQAEEIFALWREFEERKTPESSYANALDRLQPMLQNYFSEGQSWRRHNLTSDRVLERNSSIREGSETLWDFAREMIRSAVDKGYLTT